MQRTLSWVQALAELKADRATRPAVREERLRTTIGLRNPAALPLSAWRGRSGRRYVVGVHALSAKHIEEAGDCVLIAVRRDAAGIADLIDVASTRAVAEPDLWVGCAEQAGANELHIHRLAEIEPHRLTIVGDLCALESEAA